MQSRPPAISAPTLRIAGRSVGSEHPAYLIAEIGSNHDGDLGAGLRLLEAVADAGADAVKFQSFRAAELTCAGDPSFAILRALELAHHWHAPLRDAATARGLDFLSTPFDAESACLLKQLGTPAIKIASGDLTHHALLRHVATLELPVLLSTGLADLTEVRAAVGALGPETPLVLLHCVAEYPAPFGELNLRAIPTLAAAFGRVVGFSDHSPGHAAVLGARALGAAVIEKHVTFDRSLPGPDHGYALTVEEFAAMATDVRRLEQALGDGQKRPAPGESAGRRLGRRSVHAAVDLPEGSVLEPGMWKLVRPADGIDAARSDELRGRRLARGVARDEPITWEHMA